MTFTSETQKTHELIDALVFYSMSPDGQYDQLVVELINQELARRPLTAKEVLYRNEAFKGAK